VFQKPILRKGTAAEGGKANKDAFVSCSKKYASYSDKCTLLPLQSYNPGINGTVLNGGQAGMADIREHQTLRMTNVLSYRKRAVAAEFQAELARIGKYVEDGGYTKTGPTVTATFAAEVENGEQTLDMEVLIPMDKPFAPPEGCACKPEFLLTNAVVIRHTGNPAGLEKTVNELLAYIQQKDLQPITPAYNVTVKEARMPVEVEEMVVDVYIGISPNIL
jgi:effector-binding domain-containing protein